jgi:hypothetical protein
MPNPAFVIQTSSDFQTYFTLRAVKIEGNPKRFPAGSRRENVGAK